MSKPVVAYCDESGQRDYGPKTDNFFVVSAALVQEDEGLHLADEFRGLKRALLGNPDIEIKSVWLRIPDKRQKYYTSKHGLTPKELDSFVSAAYDWLGHAPITLLAGVVDKKMMQEKYTSPHYAGSVAYTMFMQRYQKVMAKRGARGRVVFDDPAGKSPGGFEWRDLLKSQHKNLRVKGCPYTGTKFDNIDGLTFADSAAEEFIQLADLIAYNTFRQFREHGKAWEDKTVKTLPMYEYFERVSGSFDVGPNGEFSGYGVSKYPVNHKVRWVASERK